MTVDELNELNALKWQWDKIVDLQQGMARELNVKTGVEPDDEQYRNASRYVMGNNPKVITPDSWRKIYFLIAEDVEQERARAKVEFEQA